jgi:hypothetical protein
METVSTQPDQHSDVLARDTLPTTLGAATLLFALGYAIGSGRYQRVAERGIKILGAIGLVAFDRIASSPVFQEHRQAG